MKPIYHQKYTRAFCISKSDAILSCSYAQVYTCVFAICTRWHPTPKYRNTEYHNKGMPARLCSYIYIYVPKSFINRRVLCKGFFFLCFFCSLLSAFQRQLYIVAELCRVASITLSQISPFVRIVSTVRDMRHMYCMFQSFAPYLRWCACHS